MNEPRILSSENPVCVYPGMILDLDGTSWIPWKYGGALTKSFWLIMESTFPPTIWRRAEHELP